MQLFGPLSRGARQATRGQVRPHVAGLPEDIRIRPVWIPVIDQPTLANLAAGASFEDSISLASDLWICAILLTAGGSGAIGYVTPGLLNVQLFRLRLLPSGEVVSDSLQQKAVLDINFAAINALRSSSVNIVQFALQEMGGQANPLAPFNQALRPYFTMRNGVAGGVFDFIAANDPFYLKKALWLPADTTLQARVQFSAPAGVTISSLQLVVMGYIPE